jgi:hypothetical protein
MGELVEVTQVKASENLFIVHEPDPEAGPVAVEISYRIQPERTDVFLEAVSLLRAPRRRDGATFWRVYRDLSDASRFVERFIVTSLGRLPAPAITGHAGRPGAGSARVRAPAAR